MNRRSVFRVACVLPLSALTLFSLAWPDQAQADYAWNPFGVVWVLAAVVVAALYWQTAERLFRRENGRLWALACFFALWMTLGASFALHGDPRLLTQSRASLVKCLLYFVGRAALYGAAMAWIRDRMRDAPPRAGAVGERSRFRPYLGALLLAWLAYAVVLYPGCLTRDSVSQLAQVLGKEPLSAAHPVAQTALLAIPVGLARLLGSADAATAISCYGQMLLLAVLLAYGLERLRRSGLGQGWLVGLLILYALMPVYPTFGMTLCKDVPFGMAVLLLSIALYRLVSLPAGEKPGPGLWVQLLVAAALTTLLRNAGFFVAAATLAAALVWVLCTRRRALRLMTACALALSVAVYAALSLLTPALGFAECPDQENYSIPLQQTARCLLGHRDELTAEELATLSAVLDVDLAMTDYDPELSDPVKWLWNADATEAERSAYFRLWASFLRRWPDTCLVATFHNAYGYLYPGYVTGYKKPHFSVRPQAAVDLETIAPEYAPAMSARAGAVDALLEGLLNQPLGRLLIAPGLYGWLLLFALALCAGKTRRRALLPLLPLLLVLLGLFASAVNGYMRYAMPIYLGAPWALGMAARVRRENGASAFGGG